MPSHRPLRPNRGPSTAVAPLRSDRSPVVSNRPRAHLFSDHAAAVPVTNCLRIPVPPCEVSLNTWIISFEMVDMQLLGHPTIVLPMSSGASNLDASKVQPRSSNLPYVSPGHRVLATRVSQRYAPFAACSNRDAQKAFVSITNGLRLVNVPCSFGQLDERGAMHRVLGQTKTA